MTPRFCTTASVISYNYVRYLCSVLGFGMRRDGDDLWVYPAMEGFSYYVKKDTSQEAIGRLYVDEGSYSDAMYEGFSYDKESKYCRLPSSRMWEEVVDATDFMSIICRHLNPDHKFEGSPYMGSGKSKRFMQSQYAVAMLEIQNTGCGLEKWELMT